MALLNFTLARYGLVTLLSYVALLAGTALLIEVFDVDDTFAYATTLALVYVGVYLGSAGFVFRASDHHRQGYRFIALILAFWVLNSVLFKALVSFFALHYLVAACLNILVFGPLRYLLNKHWVFGGR